MSPPLTRLSTVSKMLIRIFGSWSNFLALYLSTVTSVALMTHKAVTISLHGPFAAWQILFLAPFTYCFDITTLLLLNFGLRSSSRLILSLAGFASFTIIVCSSTTFAVYREANAEVEWGRSIEVGIVRLILANLDPWKLGLSW
jgi:hypothetical protein